MSTQEKVDVLCTSCGKTIKAPPSMIGKTAACPGCGAQVFLASVASQRDEVDWMQPPPRVSVQEQPQVEDSPSKRTISFDTKGEAWMRRQADAAPRIGKDLLTINFTLLLLQLGSLGLLALVLASRGMIEMTAWLVAPVFVILLAFYVVRFLVAVGMAVVLAYRNSN